MVKRLIKCPKCNSKDLYITELWQNYIEFEQIDGVIDTEEGNLNESNPYKLKGTCQKCCHNWTIKNATQITDLCGG